MIPNQKTCLSPTKGPIFFTPQKKAKLDFSEKPSNKSLVVSDFLASSPNAGKGLKNSQTQSPIMEKYSDRFIPLRSETFKRNLFCIPSFKNSDSSDPPINESGKNDLYQSLLQEELSITVNKTIPCRTKLEGSSRESELSFSQILSRAKTEKKSSDLCFQGLNINDEVEKTFRKDTSILSFKSPIRKTSLNNFSVSPYLPRKIFFNEVEPFNHHTSEPLEKRKIQEKPYKILDAPGLENDFYKNLLDWGPKNIIAVCLDKSVYFYNPKGTSNVTKLPMTQSENQVCSLNWSKSGDILALGGSKGIVELWDYEKQGLISELKLHTDKIGTLTWNNNQVLFSGSKDKSIKMCDIRMNNTSNKNGICSMQGHIQEVCGLKCSSDDWQLASGGNDNKLNVWSLRKNTVDMKYSGFKAAVKALCWSPHQSGVLIAGGGTKDRTIKIFNTWGQNVIGDMETPSQICNLLFSSTTNEFVSSHGSPWNNLVVWKYPNMEKLASLEGHKSRVLYISLSPDGRDISSGAADENIHFWNVFPEKVSQKTDTIFTRTVDSR